MRPTLQQADSGLHNMLGVRRVLNGSGTWTTFGSSVVSREIADLTAQALQSAFVIEELQDRASDVIAASTGAEAGFVTNCSAAGLTITCAALIAGMDLARIHRLPLVDWPKKEILIQKAHAVDFGAQITQMVRLSGAEVIEVGSSNWCEPAALSAYVSSRTAGALFVRSHLCPQRNLVPLHVFADLMRQGGVPVIVDAAAEFDIRTLHRDGADLAIHSSQKFPGGPTAGVISGKSSLIAAVRAQSVGLGRPMKASKEAIVGAMVALNQLSSRDHVAVRAHHIDRLERARSRLAGIKGVSTSLDPDPTANPLTRLRVTLDTASAGISASQLASLLLVHDPVVATRDSSAEHGYILIDPRSLTDAELRDVCDIIRNIISQH